MAKRMQEQEDEDGIVAKSKLTTMNLAVSVSTSSSTVNSPIASKSQRILKAPLSNRLVKYREIGPTKENNQVAASSSQG